MRRRKRRRVSVLVDFCNQRSNLRLLELAIMRRLWDCATKFTMRTHSGHLGVVVVSKIQSQEDSLFSNQEHRTQYFKSPSGPLVIWNILRISECANCNSHSQLLSPIQDKMTRQHIVRERHGTKNQLNICLARPDSQCVQFLEWKPLCGYKSGTTKAHWKAIWDRTAIVRYYCWAMNTFICRHTYEC